MEAIIRNNQQNVPLLGNRFETLARKIAAIAERNKCDGDSLDIWIVSKIYHSCQDVLYGKQIII